MFEQIELAIYSARGILVNLVGSSPIFSKNVIQTFHDASVFRFPETFSKTYVIYSKFLYFSLRNRALAFVTVSNFSKKELEAVLQISPDKIKVVPCGSDHINLLEPALRVNREVTVVGSLAPRKNLEKVVAAFARAGYTVNVIGASGSKKVFGKVNTPPTWLSEKIVLLGRISDAQVSGYLSKSVALIIPSKYEGFGLPIVEAQRSATAVICSKKSALPETGGIGAEYFDPDVPGEAITIAENLYRDVDYRLRLIKHGLDNAMKYSWKESAMKISILFDEVGKQRGQYGDWD